MIAARSAAMAFNRWADAEIDMGSILARASRAIPAGLLSRQGFTLGFTIVSAGDIHLSRPSQS